MSDDNHVLAHPHERREQPFLYTWNRRLRHLHGISLRNLNITPPTNRARGKTITDDEYNLKTTAKTLVQEEVKTLHHARSFDDVSKAKEAPPRTPQKSVTSYQKNATPSKRPGNRRRRSTLHWASSDPRSRQQKLEAVEANRLVDTFFSIHYEELPEPIYISEVMEKSMNPSFSFFDIDTALARVCRSDHFNLKIWAKTNYADEYLLLLDLHVNLRSLQFIGKSMENFHHPLPENCVLLHLSDGIYTSFTDLPAEEDTRPSLTAAMKAMQEVNTSSFDTLMQLANLDDCIQDALETRKKLEAEINVLLEDAQSRRPATNDLIQHQESIKAVRASITAEKSGIESVTNAKVDLKASHAERRNVLEQPSPSQDDTRKSFKSASQKLQKEIDNTAENAQGQIRRICAGLLQIFPIEPIKNKTLQFTIRNIHLPNSVFDDTNRDEISAALGYTAQLVHQLSLYLSIPLPYQIEANGSNSFIRDDISAALSQRRYPLHPTSVNYKFEYGVFLLNKDVEFLMNRSGLRVLDIRHTLPNLKYLLYVCTSGTGELPARKAGGFRGLLAGRATPTISRRGSEDSVLSQDTTPSQGGMTVHNGVVVSTNREKTVGAEDSFLGPRSKGLPYRRSMLRDAG